MSTTDAIFGDIEFSAPLEVAGEPPPADDAVGDLVEQYLRECIRASVCITSDGGKKRTTLKPTIRSFGEATIGQASAALQSIAWQHVQETGIRGRYCIQLFIRDVNGTPRKHPERAYFDLSPDADAPDEEGDTNRPSSSYVHNLEEMNLRTLRMLQTSSHAVLRRDEQHHRDRLRAVEAQGANEVALARVGVEKMEAEAAAQRKGKIFDTATALLPAAFTKAMDHLGKSDEASADEKKMSPGERIESHLSASELEIFRKHIGDERWAKIAAAATYKECQAALIDLPEDVPAKMVADGMPVKKLTAMTTWRDEPKAVAAADDESAAE